MITVTTLKSIINVVYYVSLIGKQTSTEIPSLSLSLCLSLSLSLSLLSTVPEAMKHAALITVTEGWSVKAGPDAGQKSILQPDQLVATVPPPQAPTGLQLKYLLSPYLPFP